MKIPSYPKIFHVGSPYIPYLFKGDVEVTEKVDGSQFAFGVDDQQNIVMRSKGAEVFASGHDKMWAKAVEYIDKITPVLLEMPPDTYFYGEYLQRPKHNTLTYDRTPKNNIILFGVRKRGKNYTINFITEYEKLKEWADRLDLETVPLLYKGPIETYLDLEKFMERESILGREKVEGVVMKNYEQPSTVGNMEDPSFAKFVREDFKERNHGEWKGTSEPSKLETFIDSFRTEARWEKAVQHLRDAGKLLSEPKDIGALIAEVKKDLIEEEAETIKQGLYRIFADHISRRSTGGLPEWYKEKLAKKAFEGE